MNKAIEYVKNYISKKEYEILGEDENHMTIWYQLNNVFIFFHKEVDDFVTVMMSNFDEVTEENFSEIIMRCHELNEQLMQVKFYTINNNVVVSSEFYFLEEKDLEFQFEKALEGLINAKVQYLSREQ